MEMYMAIYKCRLCGKEFCHSGTGDRDTAATAVLLAVQTGVCNRPSFQFRIVDNVGTGQRGCVDAETA